MADSLNLQNDLQVKFNDLRKQIRNTKRQAAEPVRENLRRLGKMKYIMEFAGLNKIKLNAEHGKLMKRVTYEDISAAATGAGWTEAQAISAMQCEFRLGRNQMLNELKKKYRNMTHGDKVEQKEMKNLCKPIRKWTRENKETTEELRKIILED